MYSLTNLFSLGITITVPELALWIAHRIRMSGKSVMGTMSSTPQM